ncbi:MAG: ribosome assembly factor SBDS [Candidatus Nanoarchaeia archaeon]|nr:ribosome assembly factor SBDS [Candidatus Nanoarchaeia archaeon]
MDIEKSIIAHLKKKDKNFEVLVDSDKAIRYHENDPNVKLEDALVTNDIFSDVKNATRASDIDLKDIFKTTDRKEIAKIILKEGEIQLTTEHKNKLIEDKRKRIIDIIHRNAIDSKTGLPHPATRIETAMKEAKVNISYIKSAEAQVQDVIKLLRPLIPIKFETRELSVKIPSQFIGGSFRILKSYGKMLKENYENDGSLLAIIEIPAGIQEELIDQLNNVTKGQVVVDILKRTGG